MDNNQFHQHQIEQQITNEIIKGSIYNQKMSELQSCVYIKGPSQRKPLVYGSYREETSLKKVYKDQIVVISLCSVIGILSIIVLALLL